MTLEDNLISCPYHHYESQEAVDQDAPPAPASLSHSTNPSMKDFKKGSNYV